MLATAAPRTSAANDSQQSQRPEFTEAVRVHGTIVDVATSNPRFSTLVTALQAADLVTTLQGPGPFTVFAPTNDAFGKIPPAILNYLLSQPDALRSVLLYHVVPGAKDLRFAFDTLDLDTAQGQTVYVEREGAKLNINNARVQWKTIRTDNGVIYIVNSVLLPQFR
jgi:uncharacterized surface protein with fasciclin (FAS1) repeats